MKLTTTLIKLALAATALAACVYAVTCYWEDVIRYLHAGRKLYCHERSRRGHNYRPGGQSDYSDLSLEDGQL